jgi:membrane-anchored protein YejM (alkaline phosphatase superfamily)
MNYNVDLQSIPENQNIILASVDTIDLENFNKTLFKEVNNIAKDNIDYDRE